jgi:hypothetical protein
MCSPLCENCAKTSSVLVVEASFRAKSRCSKLLETMKNERKRWRVWSHLASLQSRCSSLRAPTCGFLFAANAVFCPGACVGEGLGGARKARMAPNRT